MLFFKIYYFLCMIYLYVGALEVITYLHSTFSWNVINVLDPTAWRPLQVFWVCFRFDASKLNLCVCKHVHIVHWIRCICSLWIGCGPEGSTMHPPPPPLPPHTPIPTKTICSICSKWFTFGIKCRMSVLAIISAQSWSQMAIRWQITAILMTLPQMHIRMKRICIF